MISVAQEFGRGLAKTFYLSLRWWELQSRCLHRMETGPGWLSLSLLVVAMIFHVFVQFAVLTGQTIHENSRFRTSNTEKQAEVA